MSDGRILHPAPDTYWYSDNLLALSPPYLLARAAGASVPAAGYVATLFWTVAAFGALWFLFAEVRRGVEEGGGPDGEGVDWMAPWLALALLFTPARLHGLQHFQNHAWTGWILLTAFALRHLRCRRTAALVGMAACELGLMASAPYYAVLGLFPLAAWGLGIVLERRVEWRMLARQMVWSLPFVLGFGVLAWVYARVGSPEYPVEELKRTALRVGHLLPPAWRERGLRVGGYPGLWLMAALPLSLAAGVGIRRWHRPTLVFLAICLVGVAGVAMGPRYGVGRALAFLLPPVRGMRELVRFAPVVWLLMAAWLYAVALPAARRYPWIWRAGFALVVLLALGEPRGGASRHRIDPGEIGFSAAAGEAFGAMEGVMLVVPAAPFHRNPVHMLRWQPCAGLRLVNGYSGRNTELFEAVIRAENHHGRGSPEQIDAAREAGADRVCVLRDWVPNATEERLAAEHEVLYSDAEFLVVGLE